MRLDETLRVLHEAQDIWKSMSPLARYSLIDKLPYLKDWRERTNQCIRYIADHLDEFNA